MTDKAVSLNDVRFCEQLDDAQWTIIELDSEDVTLISKRDGKLTYDHFTAGQWRRFQEFVKP